MKPCVKCKNELPDAALYCGYCGSEQPPPQHTPVAVDASSAAGASTYRPSTVSSSSKYPTFTNVAQGLASFADFVDIAGYVVSIVIAVALAYLLWSGSWLVAVLAGGIMGLLIFIASRITAMLLRMVSEGIYMSIDIEGHIARIAGRR